MERDAAFAHANKFKEPGKSRSSWLRSTFQKETQLREDTIIPKREKLSLSNHKAEMPSLFPVRKKKKLLFPNIPSPISAVSLENAQGEALG